MIIKVFATKVPVIYNLNKKIDKKGLGRMKKKQKTKRLESLNTKRILIKKIK